MVHIFPPKMIFKITTPKLYTFTFSVICFLDHSGAIYPHVSSHLIYYMAWDSHIKKGKRDGLDLHMLAKNYQKIWVNHFGLNEKVNLKVILANFSRSVTIEIKITLY